MNRLLRMVKRPSQLSQIGVRATRERPWLSTEWEIWRKLTLPMSRDSRLSQQMCRFRMGSRPCREINSKRL